MTGVLIRGNEDTGTQRDDRVKTGKAAIAKPQRDPALLAPPPDSRPQNLEKRKFWC